MNSFRVLHSEKELNKFCLINFEEDPEFSLFQSIILEFPSEIRISLELFPCHSLGKGEILIHSDIFYFLKDIKRIDCSTCFIHEFGKVGSHEEEGEVSSDDDSEYCCFEIHDETVFSSVDVDVQTSPSMFSDKSILSWKERLIQRKLLFRKVSTSSFYFFDFMQELVSLRCVKTNISMISPKTEIRVNFRKPTKIAESDSFIGYESLVDEVRSKFEIVKRTKITDTIWLWGEEGVGKTHFFKHLEASLGNSEERIYRFSVEELLSLFGSVNSNEEFSELLSNTILSKKKPTLLMIDGLNEIENDLLWKKSKRPFHKKSDNEDEGELEDIQIIILLRMILDHFLRKKPGVLLMIAANWPVPGWCSTRIKSVVYFPIPNIENRLKIVRNYLTRKGMNFESDEELERITNDLASFTPNYVAKEIKEIIQIAYYKSRIDQKTSLTWDHFQFALKLRPPNHLSLTERREASLTISPSLTWEDIGGYEKQKELCKRYLYGPIEHSSRYRQLGIPLTNGILLHGPSGCGKTMFVKALASFGKMNFVSLKCSDLFSMYTGETEKNISVLFQRARTFSPCVLFFDELDALCPSRSDGEGGSVSDSGVGRRALSTFLNELDGIESREQVFVIACTNQFDLIDSAVLRPGRMDHLIEIPLPSYEDRILILTKIMERLPVHEELLHPRSSQFLEFLSKSTSGYSGADLNSMCKDAAWEAYHKKSTWINKEHFTNSLEKRLDVK